MLFNKRFKEKPVTFNALEEYCGLLSNLEHNGLTYGVRSMPYVGKFELASVFLSSEKLLQEKIYLSKIEILLQCLLLCSMLVNKLHAS